MKELIKMKNIYINKEAIDSFYFASELSFKTGLISKEAFDKRIVELKDIVNENSNSTMKIYFRSEYLKNKNKYIKIVPRITYRSFSMNITAYNPSTKGLTEWVFHKGDPDPCPSIPHGHYLGRDHPKLDAYYGFVYDRHNEITERISRKDIISLWNEEKFRKFAFEAIIHYTNAHPHHGWRVTNPKKIPIRRKAKVSIPRMS